LYLTSTFEIGGEYREVSLVQYNLEPRLWKPLLAHMPMHIETFPFEGYGVQQDAYNILLQKQVLFLIEIISTKLAPS
jgi:hypothetical protein